MGTILTRAPKPSRSNFLFFLHVSGADPGLLVGGGANIQICKIFPKKLHEIKKILVRGGRPSPVGSASACQENSAK